MNSIPEITEGQILTGVMFNEPMENVILTQKEQARLQVLNSLLAEHVTLDQAATLMGVTTRHTRRILAAYREKGIAAVAHGWPGPQVSQRNAGRGGR